MKITPFFDKTVRTCILHLDRQEDNTIQTHTGTKAIKLFLN